MSERYVRVFTLPEGLYTPTCPVIIKAGTLLKDTVTGNIVGQLKFYNLVDAYIKALTVRLHPLDTRGESLGDPVEKEYLDLSEKQGSYFGQKVPVEMPDANTRGYTVEVIQVVFADNSVWKVPEDAEWGQLPADRDLETALGDPGLAKQFKIQYGHDSVVMPQTHKDLWQCKCNCWNRSSKCYRCSGQQESILGFDLEELKKNRDEREQKEREEASARAAAEREKAERNKALTKKIVTFGAIAVAAIILINLLITKVINPNTAYGKAKAMMDDGRYEEAIEAFEALNGKRDSKDLIEQCRAAIQKRDYDTAVQQFESGNYNEAIEAFKALGDYMDSAEKLLEAKYMQAVELKNAYKYKDAVAMFLELGDYKDSREMLLSDVNMAMEFLCGGSYEEWKTDDGKYHFNCKSTGDVSYNIPCDDPGGGYYTIENGIYKVTKKGNNNTYINAMKFTVQDEDTITIVSYKDNKSYVLHRQ